MITKNFPRGIGGSTRTGNVGSTQPYMILTSYESKNAIDSGSTPLSSIALYIPPNSLKQTTDANWEGVEGGALKAGAMGALGQITGLNKLMGGGEGVTDWGDALTNIFTSAGMTGFQQAAKALDKNTGILSAGAGIAVNNHMAMAYKGPSKFRTHEFAFNFFPKNRDDAEEIRDIIDDFQNGMLPRMIGKQLKSNRKLSKPFFQSPRHWDIEFYAPTRDLNPFIFAIKKSVITSMTVNHDPNSVVSLHADGSPVQTAFSLTFQEIELPISGDPASAYGTSMLKATSQQQGGGRGESMGFQVGDMNFTKIREGTGESVDSADNTLAETFANYSNKSGLELFNQAIKK